MEKVDGRLHALIDRAHIPVSAVHRLRRPSRTKRLSCRASAIARDPVPRVEAPGASTRTPGSRILRLRAIPGWQPTVVP